MCIILLHPVSLGRSPSFRTQPLESLTPLSINKWVPEQPGPWRKSSERESCYGDRVYLLDPDGLIVPHSAKGGAVETRCSDLHGATY